MKTEHRFRFYESVFRPFLFRIDPETAHHVTIQACRAMGAVPGATWLAKRTFGFHAAELEIDVVGLHFPNPIGLAAGWDKNGVATRLSESLGFGFTEIGSVSAEASIGNAKPRLFRLPQDNALVVNYGLPNHGANVIAKGLARHTPSIPRGANVVTTNRGPLAASCDAEGIFSDYQESVLQMKDVANYLTLNLSCPNAKDGKDFFCEPGHIRELLLRISECDLSVPVFLKVPPSDAASDQDRWLAESEQFDFVRGFIFNLASGRPNWLTLGSQRPSLASMPGAISGVPVAGQMNRCIAGLYSRMNRNRYTIIGGGGVFSADDAWQKIRVGASLVQIYTALVYHGPSVVRRINEGLLLRMRQHGFQRLSDAVGTANALE